MKDMKFSSRQSVKYPFTSLFLVSVSRKQEHRGRLMKQKMRLRKVEAPHLLVTSVVESPTRCTVITIPTLLSSPSDGLSTYLRRYYPQRLVTADRPCHPRMSFCRSTNKSLPSLLPTTYSHTETLPELTSCVTPSDVQRFISSMRPHTRKTQGVIHPSTLPCMLL